MLLASLDIETLDLERTTAVVFEIGVVIVRLDTVNGGHLAVLGETTYRPSIAEQLALGRTVSTDTLQFHRSQPGTDSRTSGSFQARLRSATQPLALIHDRLSSQLSSADEIWINGLSFDPVVLHYLFKSIGKPLPWHFRKERDVRTVRPALKLCGIQETFDTAQPRHHAIVDARWNMSVVDAYYGLLRKHQVSS